MNGKDFVKLCFEEKEKFQQLSELHEMVVKGKLTSPQACIDQRKGIS